MTDPVLIEKITRSLAYMLRHRPERFDLDVDAHGFADIDEVIRALNERIGEPVEEDDLEDAVTAGDRQRYEIEGDKVRALYGHSIPVEPGPDARPPEELYVGLSTGDVDRAMRFGLRGGRRSYLHLALTEDDAREAGRRLAEEYTILTVRALDAWEDGVRFYDRKALFLAEEVPTEMLEVGTTYDDGEPPRERGGFGRDGGGRGRRGRRGRRFEEDERGGRSERPEREERGGRDDDSARDRDRDGDGGDRHPRRRRRGRREEHREEAPTRSNPEREYENSLDDVRDSEPERTREDDREERGGRSGRRGGRRPRGDREESSDRDGDAERPRGRDRGRDRGGDRDRDRDDERPRRDREERGGRRGSRRQDRTRRDGGSRERDSRPPRANVRKAKPQAEPEVTAAPAAAAPTTAPEPGTEFGLGILEPAAPKAKAAPAAKPEPAPKPEPAAEPEVADEPESDFGFGI